MYIYRDILYNYIYLFVGPSIIILFVAQLPAMQRLRFMTSEGVPGQTAVNQDHHFVPRPLLDTASKAYVHIYIYIYMFFSVIYRCCPLNLTVAAVKAYFLLLDFLGFPPRRCL